MKRAKWLLAILICLALCVMGGLAAADDAPQGDGPFLFVSRDQAEAVQVNQDRTEVTSVPMHQWIDFDVSAPGGNGITIYWVDEDPDADPDNPKPE